MITMSIYSHAIIDTSSVQLTLLAEAVAKELKVLRHCATLCNYFFAKYNVPRSRLRPSFSPLILPGSANMV